MLPEEFVLKQLELLEWEREEEINETKLLLEGVPSKELERRGVCLRKLSVGSKRSGLYGRTLVKFEPQWSGTDLPSHSFTSGDIVGVTTTADYGHHEVIISGVIWAMSRNSVTVAFDISLDELPLNSQLIYILIKLANDVTYRRIRGALKDLSNYRCGCATPLIDILFESSSPSEPHVSLHRDILDLQGKLKFHNENLDDSQRSAVHFALCQRELAIVHGPPGTGKTTTVVEVIQQMVAQGLKVKNQVLVCGPSNVAVDNVGEKLSEGGVRMVRLGHPARTLQSSQDFSLDARISLSDNGGLVCDIRSEMEKMQRQISKSKDKGETFRLRGQAKLLARELITREKAAMKEVLQGSDVVMATLTSSYSDGPLRHLDSEPFDVVVIDECSQALEAACWIPLLQAPKCVLAGDHLQLPPTIVSKKAAEGGFEVTLMERLMSLPVGQKVTRMLTTQYRMNESIMAWPSQKLYEGKLVAHSSVKGHLLCGLDGVVQDENTSVPLILVDTAGCDFCETVLNDEMSKANEVEAKLVALHTEQLVSSGVNPKDIAVIAPYNLQVDIIRSMLSQRYPGLEIKSVDGFQGREKEAVILSLVRSNDRGEVGFLAEDRRINVAITRARRHLAVVCDSDTVSHHPFLKDLMEYMNRVADVRSAHQYSKELDCSGHLDKAISRFDKKRTVMSRKPGGTTAKSERSLQKDGLERMNASAKSTTHTKTMPEQTDEIIYSKYQKILENFVCNSKSGSYTFPSSLSSFERRIVHSISEKLGLEHESQNEGDHRCIMVRKVSPRRTAENVKAPKVLDVKDAGKCISNTDVLSNRFAVISVDDSNIKDNSCSDTELEDDHVPDRKKERNNTSESGKSGNLGKGTGDSDSFLDKAVRLSKKCSFPRCKKGTAILRQVCTLCNLGFCLEHHIPEVHGCGDAARALARQRIRREGAIVPGSGAISRKPKPKMRKLLEKQLDKKLTELGNQRVRKKKESK